MNLCGISETARSRCASLIVKPRNLGTKHLQRPSCQPSKARDGAESCDQKFDILQGKSKPGAEPMLHFTKIMLASIDLMQVASIDSWGVCVCVCPKLFLGPTIIQHGLHSPIPLLWASSTGYLVYPPELPSVGPEPLALGLGSAGFH